MVRLTHAPRRCSRLSSMSSVYFVIDPLNLYRRKTVGSVSKVVDAMECRVACGAKVCNRNLDEESLCSRRSVKSEAVTRMLVRVASRRAARKSDVQAGTSVTVSFGSIGYTCPTT